MVPFTRVPKWIPIFDPQPFVFVVQTCTLPPTFWEDQLLCRGPTVSCRVRGRVHLIMIDLFAVLQVVGRFPRVVPSF